VQGEEYEEVKKDKNKVKNEVKNEEKCGRKKERLEKTTRNHRNSLKL